MAPKEAAEEAASLVMLLRCPAERGVLGGFGSVLFPVVHLLLELSGLFLVNKGQASPAFLDLEGMEEGPIGIVRPGFEEFLVPYDTPIARLREKAKKVSMDAKTAWLRDCVTAACSPIYPPS